MPSALSRTGLSSTGADYTFFQSGTMMNVSGPVIASAYKAFVRTVPVDDRADARLVVLHDELESPLGKIRVRVGGSAKGHNGLKSVMQALGGREFVRIGVGIGRPESRERGDVAEYVLRKMRREEIEVVRERAREVVRVLDRLREGREV
jgi:PTH1 family peptidyl-tRNA hydrolase